MKLWGIHGLRVPLCASVSVLNFGLTLTATRKQANPRATPTVPLCVCCRQLLQLPVSWQLKQNVTKCNNMQRSMIENDRNVIETWLVDASMLLELNILKNCGQIRRDQFLRDCRNLHIASDSLGCPFIFLVIY